MLHKPWYIFLMGHIFVFRFFFGPSSFVQLICCLIRYKSNVYNLLLGNYQGRWVNSLKIMKQAVWRMSFGVWMLSVSLDFFYFGGWWFLKITFEIFIILILMSTWNTKALWGLNFTIHSSVFRLNEIFPIKKVSSLLQHGGTFC